LDELERVQRWEVGLVALPMGILGVVVGSGVFLPYLLSNDPAYAWIPGVVDAATIVVGAIAVRASARLTRPWLTRSVAASNLRTE
jgi:ABC-type Fe3+ transport system permease subunit